MSNISLVVSKRIKPVLTSSTASLVRGSNERVLPHLNHCNFSTSTHIKAPSNPWTSNPISRRSNLPTNTIIKFVPQQEAWIVERMGRFNRVLEPGPAILIPFLDKIRYVKSLKEVAVEIPTQTAITADNVSLQLESILYYKIYDPFKASYGIEDHEYAVTQLAQTTMRAEIGQLTLDRTLAERNRLNENIVRAINHAAEANWGLRCLRYEIKDIHPPDNVVAAMQLQVSSERRKRSEVLESEGQRQAAINIAEGQKQAVVLNSEAERERQINEAQGEAEAILLKAKATAEQIMKVSKAIAENQYGREAVSLAVAEKYVESLAQLAKESTTVVLPKDVGNVASVVTEALTVFDTISKKRGNNTVAEEKSLGTFVSPYKEE